MNKIIIKLLLLLLLIILINLNNIESYQDLPVVYASNHIRNFTNIVYDLEGKLLKSNKILSDPNFHCIIFNCPFGITNRSLVCWRCIEKNKVKDELAPTWNLPFNYFTTIIAKTNNSQ